MHQNPSALWRHRKEKDNAREREEDGSPPQMGTFSGQAAVYEQEQPLNIVVNLSLS